MTGTGVSEQAIAGYAAEAPALIARYDDVTSAALYAPVTDLLPQGAARVLDIGAGTGRDAAWFAAAGHAVVAAEPVAEFRAAIRARQAGIQAIDTRLPDLAGITGPFDLITCNAVWQHLDPRARPAAWRRIAALLRPGGRAILSLRLGRGHPDRPVVPIEVEAEIALAARVGLTVRRRHQTASHQAANIAAGVRWTWLALDLQSEGRAVQ